MSDAIRNTQYAQRNIVCIECPNSCVLRVGVKDGKVAVVDGAKCPKGVAYAAAESENPTRILTSTALAEGLSLKLVPVRTDKPIPKKDILRAVGEIRKIVIKSPVKAGDVVAADLLGLGANLIATRQVYASPLNGDTSRTCP
jgi:CxxC motif-containing protein